MIDLLAYSRPSWDQPGDQDIDYATLEVQHLGSIYEGLLELRPRVADEPLVEVATKDGSAFRPAADVPQPKPLRGAPPRRIGTGEVYLVTDRGERKSSGSYYTPKYVVDYMVAHTVGPLADAAALQVAALRPAVDAALADLEQQRVSLFASGLQTHRVEAEALLGRLEAQRHRLLEPYLSLTILDPAMGSGHFLVGAADYLSLAMATDPSLLDLAAMGDEDSQLFYKRLVVERCLYGVDLNPLAVELAKLSLWLHTVSGDRALSFLDHHLRPGNSLIGARLQGDLDTPVPRVNRRGQFLRDDSTQLSFGFADTLQSHHLGYLLDTFRRIAEAPAGDATAERAKARWYDEMDKVREPFRQVANLWLAPYFGVALTDDQYGQGIAALGDPDRFVRLTQTDWFQAAQTVAREQRCFHWELEFPEVFLTPTGPKPATEWGFAAVVGNPPYVRQEELKPLKSCLAARFPDTQHGMADLFVYFFDRGLALLRPGQRLSYISANGWLQTAYAEPLRRYIRSHATVESLVDLGDNRVFPEAPGVWPSIFVII